MVQKTYTPTYRWSLEVRLTASRKAQFKTFRKHLKGFLKLDPSAAEVYRKAGQEPVPVIRSAGHPVMLGVNGNEIHCCEYRVHHLLQAEEDVVAFLRTRLIQDILIEYRKVERERSVTDPRLDLLPVHQPHVTEETKVSPCLPAWWKVVK